MIPVPHNTLFGSRYGQKATQPFLPNLRGDYNCSTSETCLSRGLVSSHSRLEPAASGPPLQLISVCSPTNNLLATPHHVLHSAGGSVLSSFQPCPETCGNQRELLSSLFIFSSSTIVPPLQHGYWEVTHLKLLPSCSGCHFYSQVAHIQLSALNKKDNTDLQ